MQSADLLSVVREILIGNAPKPPKVRTVPFASAQHHYTGGFLHPTDLMCRHLADRGEPIWYDASKIKTGKQIRLGNGTFIGAKGDVTVEIRRIVHPPIVVPKQGKREARRRKRQMAKIVARQSIALAA